MTDLTITAPGIYDGIPDEDYHADPVPGGIADRNGMSRLRYEPGARLALAGRSGDLGGLCHERRRHEPDRLRWNARK